MKITFHKLFSLIFLSVALAGGLVSTANAQFGKLNQLMKSGSQIEMGGHYKPSITPWSADQLNTHQVSGVLGTASGGVDLKTLETRSGTYVNQGQNGVGVGAAGQAHLVRVTGGGSASTGTIQVQGRDILGNEAKGSTEAYIGARGFAETGVDFGKDPTIKAIAGGFAGQNVSAQGDARTNVLGGGFGVNGGVSAGVGAEASAGLSVTKEMTRLGLGGFAGDSASATAGFDVLGVGAGVTATGYAGVGAGISSQSSFAGGKLRIKGEGGLALGVGGRVGIDLTIDLTTIDKEGKAFVNNIEHFGGQAGEGFKKAGEDIDRDIKQAGAVIDRDLNKFGNDTKAVFEQQIPDAFNHAGNDVKNFFERDVKNSLEKAGGDIGNAFKSLKFW